VPAPVKFLKTDIEGVRLVKTTLFQDQRGFFSELWSEPVWAGHDFSARFTQDNLSLSARGVLRGMHYQINPGAMGKLVRCVRGAIYDVAVDLRRGSPTYGRWVGQELSEQNAVAMWVPEGFAHGFLALEDGTEFLYKTTAYWHGASERSIRWDDPTIGVKWPLTGAPVLSEKDAAGANLADKLSVMSARS
jgi:dTDP-4-dehydrorhamnose 3,5-epimerase